MVACASPSPPPALIPAAISARGGPLPAFERTSELQVHYGFPGRWRWTLALQRPDHLRITLETSGEDQTFVSDAGRIRTFLGRTLVNETRVDDPCLPSMLRWVALVNLDALASPPFAWREIEAGALPAGAARGARVHCTARPAEGYTLLFDEALRLVSAEGPVEIPVLGRGRLEARFGDYREAGGRRLPFDIDYQLDGQPFLEERVERVDVGPRARREGAALPRREPAGPRP